jgi:hypothetical protein
VILDAAAALDKLVPHLTPRGERSVALLRTATPRVLVFTAGAEVPVCTLEFGRREDLEKIHSVLSRLHPLVPDLVPESLACEAWDSRRWVLVQSGLAGRPWFGLTRRTRTGGDWEHVLNVTLEALDRLHGAVRRIPEWTSSISPAAELRAVGTRLATLGVELPEGSAAAVEAQARELEELGEVAGFCQHGDFCLNNVMIGAQSVGIVDFEDFGLTSMPLQDRIGLALSVAELSSTTATVDPVDPLAVFLGRGRDTVPPPAIPGLVLYYLLWRVERAHGVRERSGKKTALLRQIADFVASPESFRPGSMAGKTAAGRGGDAASAHDRPA